MRRFIFRVLLVFACVFLFQIAAYAQKEKAWAKLEPLKTSFIKGEPIYITFIRYGTPYSGDFYLDGKLCHSGGVEARPDQLATTKNVSSAQKEPQFNPETRRGVAPLFLLCDLKIKEMQNRAYELCYKDRWVEGCASFSLEEPTGEDAELYKKMKPDAHDIYDSGLKIPEIIDKYPTSTYAAWAIINTDCGARLPSSDGKRLLDDMFLPGKEKDIYRGTSGVDGKDKNIWVTPEEFAEKFVPKAEQVLQAHPDHPNAGLIYARLSLAYMVLHRWQDAFQAAKKSLELPWAEWVYSAYLPRLEMEKKVLREAKDELLKRGLAKDKDK